MFYRVLFRRDGKLDWTKIFAPPTDRHMGYREVRRKFKDLLEFLYADDYGDREVARVSARIEAITPI